MDKNTKEIIPDRPLNKADLTNTSSAAVLGMIVARQLIEFGQSSVYLDEEDNVAIASPGELSLDGIPEEMAINTLVSNEWDEEAIVRYLAGREARMKKHV